MSSAGSDEGVCSCSRINIDGNVIVVIDVGSEDTVCLSIAFMRIIISIDSVLCMVDKRQVLMIMLIVGVLAIENIWLRLTYCSVKLPSLSPTECYVSSQTTGPGSVTVVRMWPLRRPLSLMFICRWMCLLTVLDGRSLPVRPISISENGPVVRVSVHEKSINK